MHLFFFRKIVIFVEMLFILTGLIILIELRDSYCKHSFLFFKFYFERGRAHEWGWGRLRERERERERIPSRLCAIHAEPGVRLDPVNREIMT